MESFAFISLPLLAGAALVFFAVLAGIFSTRVGFPFLLVFLLAGGIAGEDGFGIQFDNFTLSFWVGNVALAIILVDGGLRTRLDTFRTGLKPSLLLATLGVLVTAGVTGVAAKWLLALSWPMAFLLGAIVASTDAAAVFSVLKTSRSRLNERVKATLEIESGMNDPMAVLLTILFIEVALSAQGAEPWSGWYWLGLFFVNQFAVGGIVGFSSGVAIAWLVRKIRPLLDGDSGIVALLLISAGVSVFALANWSGGSGFLAAYVFAVTAGNRARRTVRRALSALDGLAWMAQAAMFLLLGLLVSPSELLPTLLPALAIAAVMMFVARPAATALCLAPLRFRGAEILFISWVGLRGAVPIVLALFPVVAGVPEAGIFFNVAFVVVLSSLLLQASTLRAAARKLQMLLPETSGDDYHRALGHFVLDAATPMNQVARFYNLPGGDDPDITIGDWCAKELRRPPVVGDKVRLGDALLVIRAMDGGEITKIAIKLGD